MFEAVSVALEGPIDELSVPVDRAALARAFRLLDRLSAKGDR